MPLSVAGRTSGRQLKWITEGPPTIHGSRKADAIGESPAQPVIKKRPHPAPCCGPIVVRRQGLPTSQLGERPSCDSRERNRARQLQAARLSPLRARRLTPIKQASRERTAHMKRYGDRDNPEDWIRRDSRLRRQGRAELYPCSECVRWYNLSDQGIAARQNRYDSDADRKSSSKWPSWTMHPNDGHNLCKPHEQGTHKKPNRPGRFPRRKSKRIAIRSSGGFLTFNGQKRILIEVDPNCERNDTKFQ